MDSSKVVFLDCETSNLYPQGEIWELGFILDGEEFDYYFELTDWSQANARALAVGRYYERTKDFKDHYEDEDTPYWSDPIEVAPKLAAMFEGRHIVGAVPNFDENFLRDWFTVNDAILTTHYHLIDIEAMVVGFLMGTEYDSAGLPWKSEELSRAIGVDPEQFDRHTALGDARWVRAQWDVVVSGVSP